MFTLTFLVCNTLSWECYAASSGTIHKDKISCEQEALTIIARNEEMQDNGERPPEKAIYVCYDWGQPA